MKFASLTLKNKFFNSFKFGVIGFIISILADLITSHSGLLLESSIIGLMIGFLIGLFENFITIPKFRRLPFYLLVAIRTIVYSGIIISSIFMIVMIKLSFANKCALIDVINNDQLNQFFWENDLHIIFLVLIGLSFVINVIWQINLLLGKGVLLKYITGKYHKPTREERIFLFLDLKSSTSIAEKLGDERYSSFLQDFFHDITEPILEARGEIFQYCGDEVVIVWNVKKGKMNNNALRFFFLVENIMIELRNSYLKKYGIYPEFKAGLHYGEILITEVGYLKKEIAYHGDLINTTNRILNTCNKVGRRLLVSEDLLVIMDWKTDFEEEFIGEFRLKGKKRILNLYSIKMKGIELAPLNSTSEENMESFCPKNKDRSVLDK
ncbi:MAG: adenylate/guanylate cyclase domain-containing protein [Melioribacteraceae bacterium]|nr:adenylate/guanylate cyclase domain-containing protein [Melioribacteraceae bacterium]